MDEELAIPDEKTWLNWAYYSHGQGKDECRPLQPFNMITVHTIGIAFDSIMNNQAGNCLSCPNCQVPIPLVMSDPKMAFGARLDDLTPDQQAQAVGYFKEKVASLKK